MGVKLWKVSHVPIDELEKELNRLEELDFQIYQVGQVHIDDARFWHIVAWGLRPRNPSPPA